MNDSKIQTPEKSQDMKLIVITDDEPDICFLLREALEQHVILAINNGIDAVRFIERFRPDLAIIDIYMPGLKGDEVIKQIKDTKCLVFTGNIDFFHKEVPVIYKPNFTELSQQVNLML